MTSMYQQVSTETPGAAHAQSSVDEVTQDSGVCRRGIRGAIVPQNFGRPLGANPTCHSVVAFLRFWRRLTYLLTCSMYTVNQKSRPYCQNRPIFIITGIHMPEDICNYTVIHNYRTP